MEETSERTSGRSAKVRAIGNTADEIELNAIDQARGIFGPELRLQVVRDYQVGTNASFPPDQPSWYAMVSVQVVE